MKPGIQWVKVRVEGQPIQRRLDLKPGEAMYLIAEPGHPAPLVAVSALVAGGLVAALAGGTSLAFRGIETWSQVTALAGLGAFGLGVGLAPFVGPSFEQAPEPPAPEAVGPGVSFSAEL